MSRNPVVSVVAAACNKADQIGRLLSALRNQRGPAWEVLIVDDHSSDDTYERASRLQDSLPLRVLRNAYAQGKKYALRTGVEAAQGEVVLFTDADCIPCTERWVAEMIEPFQSTDADMVVGVSRLSGKGGLRLFQQYDHYWEVQQARWLSAWGMPYWAVGRNWACRRRLWLRLIDVPDFWRMPWGDDDLAVRFLARPAGYHWQLSPEAAVCTPAETTFRRWLRQKHRHIRGGVQYPFRVWMTLALMNVGVTGAAWTALSGVSRLLSIGMAAGFLLWGMYSRRRCARWGMNPGPWWRWLSVPALYHAFLFPWMYLTTLLSWRRRKW